MSIPESILHKGGLGVHASTAHSIFAVSGRLRMFEGAEKGHTFCPLEGHSRWCSIMFCPLDVHFTVICFLQWKGTLEGALSPFALWKGNLEGTSSCFIYHRGIHRGHFCIGAPGLISGLQWKNRLGGKLVVHSKVDYSHT